MTTRRNEERRSSSPRVQEWLSKMTLEEKIGQMSQIDLALLLDDNKNVSDDKLVQYFGELGIGSLLNMADKWEAQQYRTTMIRIQEIAASYGRPPVIWGLDSVHGANYVHKAIVTPQPINLAATFNVTMAHRAGQLASRDTRASGITWLFSPILGLALEPKWSRVYETFGEDPKVVSEMGQNMIEGIQEVDKGTVPSRAAACGKHFIGYSKPHTGHDRSPSWIPTRHLYQYFVPPWRAALKNALTVMESYSEYDGVPNVANRNSLVYLLRQRLGFQGVLVTDYSEILNLHSWHHVAASDEDATVYSLQEGTLDMSMIPFEADAFRDAVEAGIISKSLSMDRIDESVERVLRLKEKLGMMDETLPLDDVNLDKVGSDEDRAEALEMARQSIVLAENHNNTLPLNPNTKIKVHITGPTADSLRYQSGGWTAQWQGPTTDDGWFTYGDTVLGAAKAQDTRWDISYSCGVDILGDECSDSSQGSESDGKPSPSIVSKVEDWIGIGHGAETTSILESASKASSADYVIVCVGEENYTEKPGDIRSLELPQGQLELVKALSETNSKVILVYFGGRPRLLRQMVGLADAVLVGFLPGPDAGAAVLDIIAGKGNPSGRMPLTYPKYEDGGGSPYYRAVSDRCTKGDGPLPHYENAACDVQWSFGHGLSYTQFEYSNLELNSATMRYRAAGQSRGFHKSTGDENLNVSVHVKNVGSRAGSETVLFFTFDESRHTTPEFKRLRSFEKILLEPGEEKVVTTTMSLTDPDFLAIGPHDDTHLVIQNGMRFQVGVGMDTDCREDASSALCSDFVTIDAGYDYSSECDAACKMWSQSGCAAAYSLSARSCWNLCTSAGHGTQNSWGWNYVNCIESVAFDIDGATNQCWKMQSLCRNVFEEGLDGSTDGTLDSTAVLLGTISGLVCSLIIYVALRGGLKKLWRRRETEDFELVDDDLPPID